MVTHSLPLTFLIYYKGENKMASIETVDFYKFTEKQTNISDVVGVGEKNERNDVMLIQTLFKLIGWGDVAAKMKFGLSVTDLPEPTGIYDFKTTQAIWGFQREWYIAYEMLTEKFIREATKTEC